MPIDFDGSGAQPHEGWRVREKADAQPEQDGDDGEHSKVKNHVPGEAAPPFHRVADSVQTPQQHERRDAGAQRQQNRQRVHQLRRIGEQHVQKR